MRLGAPYLTIGTRYLVGEHSVLPRNVKSNGSWPFLAQAPVALRAHSVRPYGLAVEMIVGANIVRPPTLRCIHLRAMAAH